MALKIINGLKAPYAGYVTPTEAQRQAALEQARDAYFAAAPANWPRTPYDFTPEHVPVVMFNAAWIARGGRFVFPGESGGEAGSADLLEENRQLKAKLAAAEAMIAAARKALG